MPYLSTNANAPIIFGSMDVEQLLEELTLEEKVALLSGKPQLVN